MPMTDEMRKEILMRLSKEALVEMACSGVDRVWMLVERLFYLGYKLGMPKELLQELVAMDDDMFARAYAEFLKDTGDRLKKEAAEAKDDPDDPNFEIIVLDLRKGVATDGVRLPTSDDSRD